MEIAEPVRWSDWLHSPAILAGAVPLTEPRRWVAHPTGVQPTVTQLAEPRPTLLAIGPEGGLSDAEIEAAAAAGWETVGLGERILRIETAALGLVACLTIPRGGGA